jgi:hypothetical protein
MWIIYKNTSQANRDVHCFIPFIAMKQEALHFTTGFIWSNITRSVTNCSYQQGHFFTDTQIITFMAQPFWLCVNCHDKPRYLIRCMYSYERLFLNWSYYLLLLKQPPRKKQRFTSKLRRHKYSSYLTENEHRFHYKDQLFSHLQTNKRHILHESYETHKYSVWQNALQHLVHRYHSATHKHTELRINKATFQPTRQVFLHN